jgi:hypothetical protein
MRNRLHDTIVIRGLESVPALEDCAPDLTPVAHLTDKQVEDLLYLLLARVHEDGRLPDLVSFLFRHVHGIDPEQLGNRLAAIGNAFRALGRFTEVLLELQSRIDEHFAPFIRCKDESRRGMFEALAAIRQAHPNWKWTRCHREMSAKFPGQVKGLTPAALKTAFHRWRARENEGRDTD